MSIVLQPDAERGIHMSVILVVSLILVSVVPSFTSYAKSGWVHQQELQSGKPDEPREIELNKSERASQVTIRPVGGDLATLKQTFSASKDKARVAVFITNTIHETIRIIIADPYIHYRPRLLMDGRPLPYKEQVAKVARQKEKFGPGSGRVLGGEVKPEETVMIDYIDLADWFGPLEPGQYELTIKYRFRHRGKPVETNTVTFEVIP
jgi:hypothetical protein